MLRSIAASLFYRSTGARLSSARELPAKWLALHALAEFLRKQQINVIIDVGANEGQFVTKVRRLGYDGLIVSFEPDPRSFSVLSSRNAGDRRWRGISVALGNTEADLVLHQTHDSVLSSLLTPLRTQNLKSDVQVHVQRLDQLFDQLVSSTYAPRVLLKTDTQGFDLEVLKGASSSLPRIHGILAEISVLPIYKDSPHFEQALVAYREAGFDLVDLSLVNRTPDGRILELDGLFVNRSHL